MSPRSRGPRGPGARPARRAAHPAVPAWALALVAAGGIGLVLVTGVTARADDPVPLSRTGRITDTVGALDARRPQVVAALDRLDREQGLGLYVVYVRDFSGRSPTDWAGATAERGGLGPKELLLAVATHDRRYAYAVDRGVPLDGAQLAAVARTAVEPALRAGDWAGTAIGAADGMAAVLAGRPVPTRSPVPGEPDPGALVGPGTGAGDFVLPVVAVGAAGAVAVYAVARKRRRATAARAAAPAGRPPGAPGPAPLPEWDARARRLLVTTDDAVRTSAEELGYATAQCGEAATRPFREAWEYARTELTAAFRLRQRLDDASPADEDAERRMLDEIVARCTAANRRLDAESAAFDRLRSLERSAPRALEHADAVYRRVDERTTAAHRTRERLAAAYSPAASLPVAGHVEQARDRLAFAAGCLTAAREAEAAGDGERAAVRLRLAEGALEQAGAFAASVERLAGELAAADRALPEALAGAGADLAEARGILDGTTPDGPSAALRGPVARAAAVLGEVRAQRAAGPYDPIGALRRLTAADGALDEVLAVVRERPAAEVRARSLLGQALLAGRSAVDAAADYVTTHRGAVGSAARTRLAEAERHLDRAERRDGGTAAALADALRADALAREARRSAALDVRSHGNPYGARPGGDRAGTGGAVLGGIVLVGAFGSRAAGRQGPGGFGGGATRRRRGGGRF
ncbi:TPM domain-containing protein [Streptomyces sp. NPDC002490]|uniref:TPM domain-containing protein n=1 Tax=Streptomyces sp. NPDC002490 TaxID=3154416 RepID=UPI0033187E6D